MIPVEAVEAAHRAWREQDAQEGSIFEYNLRAALEAAAPHMQAAWEESQNRPSVDAVKYYQERLDAAYRAGHVDSATGKYRNTL